MGYQLVTVLQSLPEKKMRKQLEVSYAPKPIVERTDGGQRDERRSDELGVGVQSPGVRGGQEEKKTSADRLGCCHRGSGAA